MEIQKVNIRKGGRMPSYMIYIFLWLFFLIIPVITNNYGATGDIVRIYYDWLRMTPFLIVFIINSLVLLPFILFRGHTKMYLLILLLVVAVTAVSYQVVGPVLYRNDPGLHEQRILQDPQYGREEMRPGPPGSKLPGNTEIFKTPDQGTRVVVTSRSSAFQLINTFLISLLVAGFNTAIAMTNKWVEEEQARKEAEKEHIRSELAFLQNQISPHFFMNTLNNIHSLVDSDHALAQNAILKLSALMRYLLYESGRGTTTLRKEIDFIRSYVSLMQLRVNESVSINLDLPEKVNDVNLPPLLFISFIENAFKHGVSSRGESHLVFSLSRTGDQIEFTSINTVPEYPSHDGNFQKGGIGLENIRKRLALLYGSRYTLNIDQTSNEFRVRLIIPA
jgi:hypothetical protein